MYDRLLKVEFCFWLSIASVSANQDRLSNYAAN